MINVSQAFYIASSNIINSIKIISRCSPFVEERDVYCETTSLSGLDHLNCRETCDTSDCNTEKIQKRNQCYTCQGTRDSQDKSIGIGDDRCWENLSSLQLQDCDFDQDYCMDEIIIDWLPKGEQVINKISFFIKLIDIGKGLNNDIIYKLSFLELLN